MKNLIFKRNYKNFPEIKKLKKFQLFLADYILNQLLSNCDLRITGASQDISNEYKKKNYL